PDESVIYVALDIQDQSQSGICTFTSSSDDTATYTYETWPFAFEEKKKKASSKGSGFLPPTLTKVSSPNYRKETLDYADNLTLTRYEGKGERFNCIYDLFGEENAQSCRVHKLQLPTDEMGAFEESCTISYRPAIPGVQEGATIAKYPDGTATLYCFSKELLIRSIETHALKGKLQLRKQYTWTKNHWLQSLRVSSGEGKLLYQKSYEYDDYGNPIRETLSGDLTGTSSMDHSTIKREFSRDGCNQLLKEETEEGKTTTYHYLPNTNLLMAKRIQEGEKILICESYSYDKHKNLIRKSVDDGTQKTITDYRLRQEAPFIHMPEWIEEKYKEEGREKLSKRTHLDYDRWGNVCQEEIYDSNGDLAYSLNKTYDESGNLLSETNALGQTAAYTYDSKGRCIQSTNYSRRLQETRDYDLKGRLIQKTEIPLEGPSKVYGYSYDAHDNLIEEIDDFGNKTSYTYDPICHRPTICDRPKIASGPVTTSATYDPLGKQTSKTDANGNTTYYKQSARGSQTEILHPNGSKESYRYTKGGKLKEHVDQEGLKTSYSYDVLGRILTKEYDCQGPLAQETYTYSPRHLLTKTDKEGHTTEYQYDGQRRKISEKKASRLIEYGYDSLGRLSTLTKHNGQNTLVIHYQRDLLDRITKEEKRDVLGQLLYKIAYGYDEDGNKREITRYINNEPTSEFFTHDPFGRLTNHQDAIGNTTKTTYNPHHQNPLGQNILQKTTKSPKGTSFVTTYDPFGNIVEKKTLDPDGHPIAHKENQFDPSGNLILEQDHIYQGRD
nr:tRNA(Glu)-specific nuclease WapA [Chlamydiota bacterium]